MTNAWEPLMNAQIESDNAIFDLVDALEPGYDRDMLLLLIKNAKIANKAVQVALEAL